MFEWQERKTKTQRVVKCFLCLEPTSFSCCSPTCHAHVSQFYLFFLQISVLFLWHLEVWQSPGDPAEVHQGAQRLPAEPGSSKCSHEQVLPARCQHPHRRKEAFRSSFIILGEIKISTSLLCSSSAATSASICLWRG